MTDREDYDYINSGREQNTIHMTSKDGYKISEKELILSNDDYPTEYAFAKEESSIIAPTIIPKIGFPPYLLVAL